MATLYVIGGSSRSGKTTILQNFLAVKSVMPISFEALREGVRNIFLDESRVTIEDITFNGNASFRRPGNLEIVQKEFSFHLSQDVLTKKALTGMIKGFDRVNRDLIIEGADIDPEYVHSLELQNLKIKAVFVGFTEDEYLDVVLTHATDLKDWVHVVIQEHNGDDSEVRKWYQETKEKNKQMALLAKEYGYGFFSIQADDFPKHVKEAVGYLTL
jgi:2-phosphoglycerate kinase